MTWQLAGKDNNGKHAKEYNLSPGNLFGGAENNQDIVYGKY